jgi:GNAT superfamily N-acetyltransferase
VKKPKFDEYQAGVSGEERAFDHPPVQSLGFDTTCGLPNRRDSTGAERLRSKNEHRTVRRRERILELLESVRIVEASEENAERLADVSERAFHTDIECGSPEKGGPPGYNSPEAQVSFMRGCDYYEIYYCDELVGALMVLRKEDQQYECCGLFVDPEYHNRGIATRAFELVWPRYPDARLWTVETPAWNTRTNHFYSKVGFVKVRESEVDPDLGWASVEYERRGP